MEGGGSSGKKIFMLEVSSLSTRQRVGIFSYNLLDHHPSLVTFICPPRSQFASKRGMAQSSEMKVPDLQPITCAS